MLLIIIAYLLKLSICSGYNNAFVVSHIVVSAPDRFLKFDVIYVPAVIMFNAAGFDASCP